MKIKEWLATMWKYFLQDDEWNKSQTFSHQIQDRQYDDMHQA